MDKHRLNSNGFLIIELLIVLFIIGTTTIISLNLFSINNRYAIYQNENQLLISSLTNIKQQAINSNSNTSISFNENKLMVTNNKYAYTINFKTIVFTKSKELYFNQLGHLNQAYTLLYKHGYKYHKIIFYLGKGWFKIE